MPVCEISYPRGLLSEVEKNAVADQVTAILLEAEGLPDNPVSRSIAVINIMESDSVYVGGRVSSQGKIVVKIYAFAEAYAEAQKSEIYTRITQVFMAEHAATREQKGNNVWCVILPIATNNFGVGGMPVSLEMTRKIVAAHA